MSPDRCERCGAWLPDPPSSPGSHVTYCAKCMPEVLVAQKQAWFYVLGAVAVITAYLYWFG